MVEWRILAGMKMRKLQAIPSLLLLLIFLGSMTVEYHTISHVDGDSTDCEWCDFALLFHTTPFEPAPETTPVTPPAFADPVKAGYSHAQGFASRDLYFRNFSRPPPCC
jgi:hypothetical protein